jgi:SPP1 family predicted phage head-tail adaptor
MTLILTPRGARRAVVTFQQSSTSHPSDGDGGFVPTWTNYAIWLCAITSAGAGGMERTVAGTSVVEGSAAFLLRGDTMTGVQSGMRIVYGARTFQIEAVHDVDERGIEMQITATEITSGRQ